MITILIADDEKLERNGIKFLLKREQEELEILEAINGKDAAGILQKKQGGYFVFGYQNALYDRARTGESCTGVAAGDRDSDFLADTMIFLMRRRRCITE